MPGLDGFMLLVLALEATLGKGTLADEVKGVLNVAAFCAFVYAFSTVLCSDLEAMGPTGRALATPIAAAGKAVAAGLPGLLLGLTVGQLVLSPTRTYAPVVKAVLDAVPVRARSGRFSALRSFHSEPVLHCAFVWGARGP